MKYVNKLTQKNCWYLTVVLFLYIYAPFLNVSGIPIHLPYIYDLVFVLIFVYIITYNTVITSYINLLGLYTVGYVWILLISAVNGVLDTNMQLVYINGFSTILSSYAIAHLYFEKYKEEAAQYIIYGVFVSGVVHAIIMALAFFSDPFRTVLYSFVALSETGASFYRRGIRSPGLTSSGSDGLSVFQASTMVFGIVYLFTTNRKKTEIGRMLIYGTTFIVLLLSLFLSARTGLVVLIFGIVLFIIYKVFIPKIAIRKKTIQKVWLLTCLCAFLVPMLIHLIMNSPYHRMAYRAFELYYNYTETGDVYTTSTNSLKEMFFLPENKNHLLFGDGNFGRDSNLPYIRSDVGYVRSIYGAGIIGTVFMYMWILYIMIMALKYWQTSPRLAFLLVFLVLTILLFNIKVFHFAAKRETFKVLFILFTVLLLQTKFRFRGN
ncbi:hypothetical protein CHISP_1784 [Chitinispirillum alkaliphilum]|nr:hypothetical protein CHISP_1784 [Chitinispirillum alkaliphilum]